MRIASFRLLASALTLLLGLPVSGLAEGHKIGVLLKGRTKFWNVVEQGALAAGAQLGAEVIVKAPPAETDIAVQILMLNALGASGVEAIVLAPAHKSSLAQAAAALAAKGIKIVIIDSPLEGKVAGAFVGTNHRAAGEAAGALLAGLVGDDAEIGFFRHAQNNAATGDREDGALDRLRTAHPKLHLHGDIYAGDDKAVQLERAELLLSKYPATKGVLASGTPGTMALLEVLAKHQPAGEIKFVGFGFNLNSDVAAALEAGTLHGWIAQQPREIGFKGVEIALALIKGEAVPPVVNVDVFVVTKANLHEPQTQALLKL
jgi:ribose transport system substrate-binding protein